MSYDLGRAQPYHGLYPVEPAIAHFQTPDANSFAAPLDSVYVPGSGFVKTRAARRRDFTVGLNFDVDHTWHPLPDKGIKLEITYYDGPSVPLFLEYDATSCDTSLVVETETVSIDPSICDLNPTLDDSFDYQRVRNCEHAQPPGSPVCTENSQTFKTARFRLRNARLSDREHQASDFRIRTRYYNEATDADSLHIRAVKAIWGPPPTVAMDPISGDYIAGLDSFQVTWSASDAYEPSTPLTSISVLLSRDGGATYPEVLVTSAAATGTRRFLATGPSTAAAAVKVVAEDIDSFTAEATSGPFYIGLPVLGPVPAVASDTLWTNTVVVRGDVTVPVGRSLTIAPGTQVLFRGVDALQSGTYTGLSELRVAGEVLADGSSESPVRLEAFSDDPDSLWGGVILLGSYPSYSRGTFRHVDFADASVFARKGSALADHTRVSFEYCAFHARTDGISLLSMGLGDTLVVSGCDVSREGPLGGFGIIAQGYPGDGTYGVRIDGGSTVSRFVQGLTLTGHAGILVADTVVDSCYTGIVLSVESTAAIRLSAGTVVDHSLGTGVTATGTGSPSLDGVAVRNSAGSGVYATGAAVLTFGANDTTRIEDSGLHGLYLNAVSGTTNIRQLAVTRSANSGIRLYSSTATVDNTVRITGTGLTGVYSDASSAIVNGLVVERPATALRATNGSLIQATNSNFSLGDYGVVTDDTGEAWLGDYSTNGVNRFGYCNLKYALNGNPNATLWMVGNCYNDTTVVKPSKFLGVGPIIYLPAYCE